MSANISIKYASLPHGLKYFYQHWIPDNPKALVVFVHDLGDHIGRYGALVSRLANEGFACTLYDQRGHGRSEGQRGHVESFSDWTSDLASFVHFSQTAVGKDIPIFLIGMGLGSLIGVNFILTHAAPVSGIITISAQVGNTIEIPRWKRKLITRFGSAFPNFSLSTGLHLEKLTGDEGEIASLKSDSFFHSRLSVSALTEIEKNLELAMAMPHRIHIPMLMLAGQEDTICDPDGTRQFAMRLSSRDKQYHMYPGMHHDLLHDLDKTKVLEDMEEWLKLRCERVFSQEKQYQITRKELLWENVSPPAS